MQCLFITVIHYPHSYIKFISFFHWKFFQNIIFFRMIVYYLRNLLPLFYWFPIRYVEISSFSHRSWYCIFINFFGIWAFRVYKLNFDFQTLLVQCIVLMNVYMFFNNLKNISFINTNKLLLITGGGLISSWFCLMIFLCLIFYIQS